MDSFFGIGLFELVLIAIIALVVLGPERLPGAMREVAKYMRQLRQISGEFQSQFSEELQLLDEINPKRIIDDAIKPPPAKPAVQPPLKPTTQPARPAARPQPQQAADQPPTAQAAPTPTASDAGHSILPPPQTPANAVAEASVPLSPAAHNGAAAASADEAVEAAP
jgi:sec-independent protein translocase protein TatB